MLHESFACAWLFKKKNFNSINYEHVVERSGKRVEKLFWMRSHISIRGCVRWFVGSSVCWLVNWLVHSSVKKELNFQEMGRIRTK